MKVVATNIFDFTTWFKFGYKYISFELIIDLNSENLDGTETLYKTGFFEEEYEIFFLEIPDSVLPESNCSFLLSLHDIISLIPLTEPGGRLLSSKIPDFRISSPVPLTFSKTLIDTRNMTLALSGSNRIFESFKIKLTELHKKYQLAFLTSLLKYFSNLNSVQDSLLDNIIFYERAKPYPLSDIGFLFDVGGIAKSRFNLSDEDFKTKALFQKTDPQKYEHIEEMLSLSKFLQNKNIPDVWAVFNGDSKESDWLSKLNQELSLLPTEFEVNNILIISLYLKFRYMIRNTVKLEEIQFTEMVLKHRKNAPIETEIALLLVGMFFGALKFKDFFYYHVPLAIMKDKPQISEKQERYAKDKTSIHGPKNISSDFRTTKNHYAGHLTPEMQNLKYNADFSKVNNDNQPAFDEMFWTVFESKITHLSKMQQKIIKTAYNDIINHKGELFTPRPQDLVNKLREKMKESTAKKIDSKLSPEIIDLVETIMFDYFPGQ